MKIYFEDKEILESEFVKLDPEKFDLGNPTAFPNLKTGKTIYYNKRGKFIPCNIRYIDWESGKIIYFVDRGHDSADAGLHAIYYRDGKICNWSDDKEVYKDFYIKTTNESLKKFKKRMNEELSTLNDFLDELKKGCGTKKEADALYRKAKETLGKGDFGLFVKEYAQTRNRLSESKERMSEANKDSKLGSVEDYLNKLNQCKSKSEVEKIVMKAAGNPNASEAYRRWKVMKGLGESKKKMNERNDFMKLYFEDKNDMSDKIFLLSADEYEKYRDDIPEYNGYWWLRTPGVNSNDAMCVNHVRQIVRRGEIVNYDDFAVRPALKISNNENLKVGDKFNLYGNNWTLIDNGLAISTRPIGKQKFDDESNNYKNSYIRQWLLNWLKEHKNSLEESKRRMSEGFESRHDASNKLFDICDELYEVIEDYQSELEEANVYGRIKEAIDNIFDSTYFYLSK